MSVKLTIIIEKPEPNVPAGKITEIEYVIKTPISVDQYGFIADLAWKLNQED